MAEEGPLKPWEQAFLRECGLLITYRCQISCPHCIVEAGPHRREDIALDEAFDWLGQIAAYRNGHFEAVSLTGGEPLYDLEAFKSISRFARGRGLYVSAVTNAFWASTREKAVAMLKELDGLQALSISTDVHHQRHIPITWVENAVWAAEQFGMPYDVAICTESADDPDYLSMVARLATVANPLALMPVITFPVGRAATCIDASRYKRTKDPVKSACLMASSPVFFPDGKVVACIGPLISLASPHPLYLGSLRERALRDILEDAEGNPILHAIRIWGPRHLVSLVQKAGLGAQLPESYIENSICHACYCLMSNPRLVEFLTELAHDWEFRCRVAYGRVYFLKETRMVELLGLAGEPSHVPNDEEAGVRLAA